MKIVDLKALLGKLADQAARDPASVPGGTETAARQLLEIISSSGAHDISELRLTNRKENIGSLVIKLAEVSKFGKKEWVDLMETYGIKVELNPRDSARDVMGKLARHLRDNPAALALVAAKTNESASHRQRSGKGKRQLAENLQDTLTRLLDD